jgi:hypothetical protein
MVYEGYMTGIVWVIEQGYLVSVSVNAYLAMAGLPMVTTPPPIPVFPANPVVGLMITHIAGNVTLQLQLSGKPGQYVLVFGARPSNDGENLRCQGALAFTDDPLDHR